MTQLAGCEDGDELGDAADGAGETRIPIHGRNGDGNGDRLQPEEKPPTDRWLSLKCDDEGSQIESKRHHAQQLYSANIARHKAREGDRQAGRIDLLASLCETNLPVSVTQVDHARG